MTSALDLLTRGLSDPTGLTVATRGLLRFGDGPLAGATLTLLSKDQATDLRITLEDQLFDLGVVFGQLEPDHGLRSAVLLSLFTDRQAEADQDIPDGTTDRRGWWGDSFSDQDPIGSGLWLIAREKQTTETKNRADEAVSAALQWLVVDGVAAAVNVTSEFFRDSNGVYRYDATIEIVRPDDQSILFGPFTRLWEATT
jgi:phage gp46-like protein